MAIYKKNVEFMYVQQYYVFAKYINNNTCKLFRNIFMYYFRVVFRRLFPNFQNLMYYLVLKDLSTHCSFLLGFIRYVVEQTDFNSTFT